MTCRKAALRGALALALIAPLTLALARAADEPDLIFKRSTVGKPVGLRGPAKASDIAGDLELALGRKVPPMILRCPGLRWRLSGLQGRTHIPRSMRDLART
jgi:hypothetical protein